MQPQRNGVLFTRNNRQLRCFKIEMTFDLGAPLYRVQRSKAILQYTLTGIYTHTSIIYVNKYVIVSNLLSCKFP